MVRQFDCGRVFQLPLPRGADLQCEIEKQINSLLIDAGTVQILGALHHAKLGCYNPELNQYTVLEVPEFAEIASGLGTISQKDGNAVVHIHVVLAGASGKMYGGHLLSGSSVFVAEVTVFDLDGIPQQRRLDPTTGLYLWQA